MPVIVTPSAYTEGAEFTGTMQVLPDMTARLLAHYTAQPADLTRCYLGVISTLTQLRDAGHRMGVCTNKHHDLSVQILQARDLAPFFDVVIGGDSLTVKKPDPAPLHAAFDALAGDPVLYVGDSEVDSQTAADANITFALFTQGYRQTPVDALTHHFAFDQYETLAPFVSGLAASRQHG